VKRNPKSPAYGPKGKTAKKAGVFGVLEEEKRPETYQETQRTNAMVGHEVRQKTSVLNNHLMQALTIKQGDRNVNEMGVTGRGLGGGGG